MPGYARFDGDMGYIPAFEFCQDFVRMKSAVYHDCQLLVEMVHFSDQVVHKMKAALIGQAVKIIYLL
ncbi:hypothetical protein KAR34_09600 [bacterium]|nr:hypothetical protein [bacterium]